METDNLKIIEDFVIGCSKSKYIAFCRNIGAMILAIVMFLYLVIFVVTNPNIQDKNHILAVSAIFGLLMLSLGVGLAYNQLLSSINKIKREI